jgi:hypothetical protein
VLLLEDLLGQLPVQEFAAVVVNDAVVTVGEECVLHLLRGNTRTHEQVNERSRVLEVDVVVTGTVLNDDTTSDVLETGSIVNTRPVVSLNIVLGELHVTLRVDGVVEAPVADGCGDHSERDDGISQLNDLGRKVSSVRPTEDTNVLLVDPRVLRKLLSSPDLVLSLELSKVRSDSGTELAALATSTTAVNSQGDVRELRVRGNVSLPVESTELLVHFLRIGTSVRDQEHRVLLAGIKVRGQAKHGVQSETVRVLQVHVGDVGQVVGLESVVQSLVVDNGADGLGGVDSVELLVRNVGSSCRSLVAV